MGDQKATRSKTYISDKSYGKISVGDYDDTLDELNQDGSSVSTIISASTTSNEIESAPQTQISLERIKRPKGWGLRHTISLMASFGLATAYAMRFNLSLAITAMVKSDPTQDELNSITANDSSTICSYPVDAENGRNTSWKEAYGTGEFEWNEKQQGMVLAAFFWGYILTQLPGGLLASKYGGKWPFGIGLAVSGVMTLLTPTAARVNIGMLLACRVIEGLAQGVIFPALQQILASWAPPNERSILSGMSYSGCQLGAALSLIITGYLITGTGSWTSVFYFSGGVTLLWFIFWIFLVYDSPEEHPRISAEERIYIRQSIGTSTAECQDHMPWKAIFTSWPVWILALVELCHSWGIYTLLMELPTYFKSVLDFSMENNSWLSAAPSIAMWVFANCVTIIADICISKKVVGVMTVRKTCHLIAEIGAGCALLGASLVGCDRTSAVILLTLAIGVSGAICGSYVPNQIEIASNYAGMVLGITNTVGNFAGFGVTIVAGALTSGHHADQHRWRSVFFIAVGLLFIGAFLYVAFGTNKEVSWNRKRIQPINASKCGERLGEPKDGGIVPAV